MDPERFDALTRLVAAPMPRRRTLRLFAGALAGALLPGLVPRRTRAADCNGFLCTGALGGTTCCFSNQTCCKFDNGTEGCCYLPPAQYCDPHANRCRPDCPPPRAPCGKTCCSPEEVCLDPQQNRCWNCFPRVRCGNDCVDTQNDPKNCGDCGHACPSNNLCRLGHCFCLEARACSSGCCPEGELCCKDTCVDPLSDANNCTACGKPCEIDRICDHGQCVCPPGETPCVEDDFPGGKCVKLGSNHDHCGRCGRACLPDEVCRNRHCIRMK